MGDLVRQLTRSGEDSLRELARLMYEHEHERLDASSLVIAAAAFVESHADRLLFHLADEEPSTGTRFGRALYKANEEAFTRSWKERLSWLAALDVDLRGTKEAHEFDLVVQVRNALVHGHGSLTPRQTRSLTATQELAANLRRVLAIETESRRLFFSPSTARLAVMAASTFVRELDKVATQNHSRLLV